MRPALAVASLTLLASALAGTVLQPREVPRTEPGRVVLVSLDGLGHHTLAADPIADELRAVHAVRARGVQADGLVAHMPSTTANTHAAMWTGAWGDVNGITGNQMPPTPRGSHSLFDRVDGFRAEALRAEPLWAAAARQGVRTVVVHASQSYPFIPVTVGTDPTTPLVSLNGYQPRLIARGRFLRQADTATVPCPAWAAGALRCVQWKAGPIVLISALQRHALHGFAMRTAASHPERAVLAPAAPAEESPPRHRPLGRHFSDALLLDDEPGVPPVTMYFRLFEATEDGGDFLLYHTPLHELALYDGARDTRADLLQLLREEGGFLGNGAGYEWEQAESPLGRAAWRGGDGTAERRYLETLEIAMRQTMRHARWIVGKHDPQLVIGYSSLPDEMEHRFMGLAASGDERYVALRRRVFELVDMAAATYASFARADDHLVLVSDHGLAAITHDVHINAVLREAGLLTADPRGAIVREKTQAAYVRNCVMLHTDDWKGGVVPVADRARVVAQVAEVLRAVRDPETGRAVITEIYSTERERAQLGVGGPDGMDICFDLQPGYAPTGGTAERTIVAQRTLPVGYHGLVPTRPEMLGLFVAAGPRLDAGTTWPTVRAIDVAPFVADLLGIQAPAQATGRSPLRRETSW